MPPGIKPIKAKPSDTGIPPTTTVPTRSLMPGGGAVTPTTIPQAQSTPIAPATTVPTRSLMPGGGSVTVGGTVLGPQVPDWSKIPGAKETRGMSPDVLTAQRDLKIQQTKALRADIPPATVENIAAGDKPNSAIEFLGKVINFDVLGKIPKTNIDLPGSFKPAATILGPLSKLDVGRRAILSTLKEVGDVGAGLRGNQAMEVTAGTSGKTGFNFSDWLKQTNDLTIGYGKLVPSPTGNKWVDRLIGFAGDVALDPLTYVSGPGGIAKTVETKAAITGAEKLIEKSAARTAALIARDVAADTARQAEIKAAEVASSTVISGAAKKAAQDYWDDVVDVLTQAEKQANIKLDKVAGKVAAEAPRRTYGAGAREALAEQARIIRQEALEVIDNPAATAAEKTSAQAAVNALTDEVILKINNEGYSAIRGAAAEVLGTQGGLRIVNPASIFGVGPSRLIIPGTEQLTNIGGRAIAGTRLGLVATPLGQRILSNITPLGEGGLYGADEIYKMRIGLRGGKITDPLTGEIRKITAKEATDFTTLLSQDKYYRGLLDLSRKESAAIVGKVVNNSNFKEVFPNIINHLQTAETEWVARGLAPLSKTERAAFDAVKTSLDKFYRQANSAALLVGTGTLPKIETYFPRAQTTNAFEWAAKNPTDATKLASDLGVDKTFFLGNFTERKLVPGKLWFGKRLTGTETIADLNRLAKESGLINFNFFEEDIAKALTSYANNHARYIAYATAIDKLTVKSPAALGGIAENIYEKVLPVKFGTKPDVMNLGALENTVANFMAPGKLVDWNEAEILNVKTKLDDLRDQLSAANINKADFEEAVLAVDELIIQTNRLASAGVLSPTAGALTKHEIDNYATALANQIKNVKGQFLVTNPARWKTVGEVVEDGFIELNKKTLPDIAVRADIAELFKNVKRLDDPAFAKAAEAVLKDYNTFMKSYATLSPGFQIRNGLSNFMAMISAGANPKNLGRGIKIYSAWRKALEAGLTPGKFLDEAVARGLIKETERDAVREALAYSGSTGFGQIGEIGAAAGTQTPGIFGREATGQLPFAGRAIPGTNAVIPETSNAAAKKLSEIFGKPISTTREYGSLIEEFNRFQLTLDGLFKGFDPQTAASRTQKFLFDYNDITKLDKNLRQIRPFWIWITRNTPLQIENMWMNPRAYAIYNSVRRNFEDKEGTSPYLPQYYKEQGAFKLPFGENLYAAPDFGFPGAGKPSLIQEIISPKQFLSSLTPPLRGLLETLANEKFFSGAPIVSKGAVNPEAEKVAYYIRELIPPAGFFRRIANATPARRFEIVQQVLGIAPPVEGEDPATKELQSLIQFFGAPGFKLRPAQERSEIWRRFFQLQDEIDRAKARAKADKKK